MHDGLPTAMYVAQVLWAWLLLEVFTPTALTQRHRQRQGYGKSQLDGESTENENVQNEAAPFGRVDYMQKYAGPFEGLYHNMPPSEEQHMRNQAQPSEDASVELTDSKEDQDEDVRKYGGPNAQGFPNGNMPEEQPYYKWKYGKSSEVMLSHMPLTEEESMKSNEEPSVGDSEGDQASEEGGNENMRKGAQRYTEDIPNPNLLEEISLHSLNPMNLRSSEEVVEENQDPEEDENTNQEGISSSNMPEEVHHYEEDYGKTFQADHQNNKTTGDETASLEGATSFEADQQKTKTMEGEASLESSMTSQADQQNTKATGDEAASLESVKTSQADQQKTKTMGGEASLKSATTSHVDQQNTKSMGDEADSVESATPSISDTSTAETTPPEVIQSRTTITEVKHIQNKTESTTTTKPSRSTVQTTPIDRTQKNTKNIEVTSTQSGTDFLDYGRGLEDRSNATVSVE
nr:dentin sialophosphoprotein precursor [Haemonchus contortus]